VIYLIKENRTFDQILGDLGNGSNGSPSLTQFGKRITPNLHNLAADFVTLDNFLDPGDGSMDGWSWSLQGRVTNTETITQQINYAFVNRGLSYESEGSNRNAPVNWATVAQRDAASGSAGTTNFTNATAALPGGTANVLAGSGNHASSDAPFGTQQGYIFDAVLQAGLTVRNYGILVTNIGSIGTKAAPVSDPFGAGIVQVAPLKPSLAPYTDLYFRGYDQNYPDLWRVNEWKREFDQFVANGKLPMCPACRSFASATTTWAASAPRWPASTRPRRSRPTTTTPSASWSRRSRTAPTRPIRWSSSPKTTARTAPTTSIRIAPRPMSSAPT
jgi:hypothetical protein